MTESIYVSGEYLRRNPLWHAAGSPWKASQVLRMMKRHNLGVATVCDVGCGAGELLKCLHDQLDETVRFVGYEISPQAFELCKARESPRLHFECKDITQEQDVSFDLILMLDLIEHVEDYPGLLKNLRPKSRYKILHIPLDLSVQSVLRNTPLQRVRSQIGHIHYFTKDLALAVLRDTGYEVLDHFYTSGGLSLQPGSTLSYLARLPRRICFAIHPDFAVRVLGGYSLMVLAK